MSNQEMEDLRKEFEALKNSLVNQLENERTKREFAEYKLKVNHIHDDNDSIPDAQIQKLKDCVGKSQKYGKNKLIMNFVNYRDSLIKNLRSSDLEKEARFLDSEGETELSEMGKRTLSKVIMRTLDTKLLEFLENEHNGLPASDPLEILDLIREDTLPELDPARFINMYANVKLGSNKKAVHEFIKKIKELNLIRKWYAYESGVTEECLTYTLYSNLTDKDKKVIKDEVIKPLSISSRKTEQGIRHSDIKISFTQYLDLLHQKADALDGSQGEKSTFDSKNQNTPTQSKGKNNQNNKSRGKDNSGGNQTPKPTAQINEVQVSEPIADTARPRND